MASIPVQVHWFPRINDKFITAGSEINLYQLTEFNESLDLSNSDIKLSQFYLGTLIHSENRYPHIRCVAPSFFSSATVAAAGFQSGKVTLCNFLPSMDNNIEFTPRQSRPCMCLAWNEHEPNLLAIGHDRSRTDHCITVWDTERGAPKESNILHSMALSETAHSFCWEKTSRVLIAGMSHKYIKMMDFRQSTPIIHVANTRTVNDVCTNGRYLASFVDNTISLWDFRSFEKPVSQIQTQKNIVQLTWCPTRSSVLSTLQRDSPFIYLYDMHWQAGPDGDLSEPYSVKRQVFPGPSPILKHLTNFSWHPTVLEDVLALFSTGAVCEYKIPQRVAVSLDTNNSVWGTLGFDLMCLDNEFDHLNLREFDEFDDIADLMQKRATTDYGQITDIQRNGDLAQNPKLKPVWQLLAHMTRKDGMLGLKTILGVNNSDSNPTMSRSESVSLAWNDFPDSGVLKIYKSEQRLLSQSLCGWTFDTETKNSFAKFIEELCLKKEFTRAALIACFHLHIRYAIDILGVGADKVSDSNSLRIAAIGLSGFNVDRNGLWRTQCSAAHPYINDPYLKAIFAFLALDSDVYDTVLNIKGVSLSDRLAFACMYLSDAKLSEHVKTTIKTCIEDGDLNGLLLTGASFDGIQLLQSYLDQTVDVQTVSLIATRIFSTDLLTDLRVQSWITSYRSLLDVWGLWVQRANFDIAMGNVRTPPRAPRSVFLLCSFCGKSVSSSYHEDARIRASTTLMMNKLSSCPHCRKPLPRCNLCLLHMGVASQIQPGLGNSGWQSKPFSKWFSWCQTCRHGGHTEHLAQWFSQNSECPVTACSCKCFAMDLPMPQFPREIT